VANVCVNDWPGESDPLENDPSSAVTVWFIEPLLVQVTVSPGAMVMVCGENELSTTETDVSALASAGPKVSMPRNTRIVARRRLSSPGMPSLFCIRLNINF